MTTLRKQLNNQRFTDELNDHVNDCQVCQQGKLCNKAERIIDAEEARREQVKKANLARKQRQAGL
jgi:hypothetical protein